MRRKILWFAAGGLALLAIECLGGLLFLKMGSNGFSARSDPSFIEKFAAQQARNMAMPAEATHLSNPVAESSDVLNKAMAHWADHCADCHANDGSGEVAMGRQMYPHAPDMRKESTQKLSDGELFHIIENGIRLSGMPAWGGSQEHEQDSWKLVHFIRHLPNLSRADIARMEQLNPKSPQEAEQEQEEQQFLNGQQPEKAADQSKR
jgi:mono/diheme cytochrome c family protein